MNFHDKEGRGAGRNRGGEEEQHGRILLMSKRAVRGRRNQRGGEGKLITEKFHNDVRVKTATPRRLFAKRVPGRDGTSIRRTGGKKTEEKSVGVR